MPARINIPPVTRITLIALTLQSLLGFAIRYRQWTETTEVVVPYLTLVPQLSIVYPWTFISSSLVESNIFTLAIGGFTLFNGGRYLERAWSSKDFTKFLVLVSLVPNFLTFCVMYFFFSMTRNERWTLTPIAGTIPVQIAFLVAFSQLVPAHTVTLFKGVLSLRVPRFPILYLGIIFVLSLTPLLSRAATWLALFGFLTSWTYLRFYKTVFPDLESGQSAPLRGDASETFAFAEFFPAPVKPAVAAVSNQIFDILVAVRICTPFSNETSTFRSDAPLSRRGPGGARAEAERRRAIALKALDQRLSAATSNPSAPGPAASSGSPVQTQPSLSAQTAMAAPPGQMLGETKYEPEQDGVDKN